MDQEIHQIYEKLKREFHTASPNLQLCGQLLSQLKVALTQRQLFMPSENLDPNVLQMTREILEIGAFWSVRIRDIASFERYYSQLKTYYSDYSSYLPPSENMYPLTGLNLLRLLSQNRISEFHMSLEQLDPELLHGNAYIRHPVQLEQCLMEGSYNKVWHARSEVPAEEYAFFVDILMETIRNEIASCSEKAYASLPLHDMATMLFFNNMEGVLTFAKQRGWNVNPAEQKIYFSTSNDEKVELHSEDIINRSLLYARELERIV
ncbi:uncharacterized protein VTP21DRAFT_3508 [Calcarisporiella thermophila]|uniref:uncharacterized protein n=1 Tax=Calcarisporiella thermophila TaxID=911321 RepID=UPI003742091F